MLNILPSPKSYNHTDTYSTTANAKQHPTTVATVQHTREGTRHTRAGNIRLQFLKPLFSASFELHMRMCVGRSRLGEKMWPWTLYMIGSPSNMFHNHLEIGLEWKRTEL